MGRRIKPFASMIHFGKSCWEWMGPTGKGGYGRYTLTENGKSRTISPHRYAFEMANEAPIPPDMVVCHSCDNPKCVRRDHLFLGTASDNQRDCVAKKRHASTKKTHCPRGHELSADNLVSRQSRNTRECRICHNANVKARYAANKSVQL